MKSLGFSTDKVISSVKTIMKWSELKSLSHVWFFATPWTVAYQAPPSMGFSRQEYWSGLPLPSPEDLPHPGWTQVSRTGGRCFTIWAMLLISFPCFITVAKTSSTVLSRCNKSRQPCHIPDHKGSFLSWNYSIFCQMCFCHLLIWSYDFLKFC